MSERTKGPRFTRRGLFNAIFRKHAKVAASAITGASENPDETLMTRGHLTPYTGPKLSRFLLQITSKRNTKDSSHV
jgi:hypothetical protein